MIEIVGVLNETARDATPRICTCTEMYTGPSRSEHSHILGNHSRQCARDPDSMYRLGSRTVGSSQSIHTTKKKVVPGVSAQPSRSQRRVDGAVFVHLSVQLALVTSAHRSTRPVYSI